MAKKAPETEFVTIASGSAEQAAHQSLVWACSRMGDVVSDTHGNVSMRAGDLVFIKPSGVPYREVNFANTCIIRIKKDGTWMQVKLEEPEYEVLKPSVDTPHHIRIYRNNPGIQAICHTHTTHVVAHAIVETPVRCMCTEHADVFGEDIECHPYRDLESWSDNLILRSVQKAVILGRHGALTFADDALKAVNLAVRLEDIAQKNMLARVIHISSPSPLRADEVQKWHRRYQDSYGQKK